jgi:hypothetical protein
MSCLCPRNEAAVLWRVAYCCWPMTHRRCVLCRESLFDEVVNGLLFELMCKKTLNTLIRIEVFCSIEPTWDMCKVLYFSSFISSNRQCSNETLVCAVIWTSDPSGPCRFPRTLPPIAWVTTRTTLSQGFSVVIYCHALDGNYRITRVIKGNNHKWCTKIWPKIKPPQSLKLANFTFTFTPNGTKFLTPFPLVMWRQFRMFPNFNRKN